MTDWNKFYLDIAQSFAQQSKDIRLKVGCVIVSQSGVIYPGYNGWAIGESDIADSLEPGQSGAVHSEQSSLCRFDPSINKGSTMYLTSSPCVVCARLIVNCQAINEVYYLNEYRDTRGIKILENCGIKCTKYEEK